MKTGWLSPSGYFIECETYEHMDIAENMCSRVGLPYKKTQADDYLISVGFVRITINSIAPHEYYVAFRFLTEEQKNWLRHQMEELSPNDYPINKVDLNKIERAMTT